VGAGGLEARGRGVDAVAQRRAQGGDDRVAHDRRLRPTRTPEPTANRAKTSPIQTCPMVHQATVAAANTISSTAARTHGWTRITARGDTNSAHTRIATAGAATPARMFQANGHEVKPHQAKVKNANSSTRNRTVYSTRVTGPGRSGSGCGAGGGVGSTGEDSGMPSVYGARFTR